MFSMFWMIYFLVFNTDYIMKTLIKNKKKSPSTCFNVPYKLKSLCSHLSWAPDGNWIATAQFFQWFALTSVKAKQSISCRHEAMCTYRCRVIAQDSGWRKREKKRQLKETSTSDQTVDWQEVPSVSLFLCCSACLPTNEMSTLPLLHSPAQDVVWLSNATCDWRR